MDSERRSSVRKLLAFGVLLMSAFSRWGCSFLEAASSSGVAPYRIYKEQVPVLILERAPCRFYKVQLSKKRQPPKKKEKEKRGSLPNVCTSFIKEVQPLGLLLPDPCSFKHLDFLELTTRSR